MIAAFDLLREQFKLFGTQGISLIFVGIAVIFLWTKHEKISNNVDKVIKYIVLLCLVLCNPFLYQSMQDFWFEETYWKVFFALVPVIMVAVFVVEIVWMQKHVWSRVLGFVACCGMMFASMNFAFTNPQIEPIQNVYKVSDEIVEVDTILRDLEQPITNMIAPREVCMQIREINESAQLLFGEDLIRLIIQGNAVAENDEEEQFISACATIVAVPSAVDYQLQVAENYGSNCIVLQSEYDDASMMEAAGYIAEGNTKNYVVYFKK